MTAETFDTTRALAIDPTTRGFGFVVFEGVERLIDWGVVHVRREKEPECLRRLGELFDRYAPDVLVVEDVTERGSRRRDRVRRLLAAIARLAARRGVRLQRIARRRVHSVLLPTAAPNKHRIAATIAGRFPELAPMLPPPRKPWMSEDERTSVFDAAGFALAYFDTRQARRGKAESAA